MRKALVACIGLTLVACQAPAPSTQFATPLPPRSIPSPAASRTPLTAVVSTPMALPTPALSRPATPSTVPLSLGTLVGHSGSDLHVALVLMLQDNAYASAAAVEAAANARLDELIAATAALDQSASTISQLVAAVRGQSDSQQVLDDWRAANSDLVQYAQGGAGTSQQDVARRNLEMRADRIATHVATGDLSVEGANTLVRARFEALLNLGDAASAHDDSRMVPLARSIAASGNDLARPWSAAISAQVPDQVPPPTESPDIDLRTNFARAMDERVYLLAWVENAAADRRGAEQQVALAAADANASATGALIASAYGEQAGSAYTDRLRTENDTFASVAGGGDRAQAVADLDRLRSELDGIVSSANVLLPPGLVTLELRSIDQPLLSATDAFEAHDYATAYARVREAARQSQRASDALADAIIDRFPSRFLVGPTPTPGVPAEEATAPAGV